MEQEEKKQKSQAAENQVFCPPQQPVEPHPFISVIPLAVLITLIVLVVKLFPDDALAGASQVALMIATAVCVALGMGIYRMKWNIFEEMIKKTVGDAGVSILILLLIGMMSATWMISGVVPTLIYYGVQIMSPTFFLPCACIISSIISVMTGTSWTTIATIGIALMGIGDALGIPAPYTAGAIISGAYFGDKLSPMSDTTVLASSIAGADLFSHIRYMLYTTIPSILLSLVLYLIIGLCYDSKPVDISQYLTGLSHGFNISLFTMLVPAFTGWLIYRKTPSLITLLLSALSACICALILQPEVLVGIAGEDSLSAKSLFEGIMTTCYTHTQVDCGMANINDLVATRGMAGMLNTIWLILCAMCFGSCMVASGMLHAITHMLLKSIHSTISLVCSTVTSGVLLNLVMGDQFLSIIMNASIYKDEYAERGYRPELLSRSTEDNGVYEWTDATTSLHSKINNGYGSWAYWNGGAAVSNYHSTIAEGTSNTQLSIPADLAAHSGSNFLMIYGSPVLDFKDGKAHTMKGLWITNGTYFLNVMANGNGFCAKATSSTQISVVFEGFKADGTTSTGTVKYTVQDGTNSLKNWQYVDLSSLGEISSLKVNYEASDDMKGDYGYNAPAYIAVDAVEIYK